MWIKSILQEVGEWARDLFRKKPEVSFMTGGSVPDPDFFHKRPPTKEDLARIPQIRMELQKEMPWLFNGRW